MSKIDFKDINLQVKDSITEIPSELKNKLEEILKYRDTIELDSIIFFKEYIDKILEDNNIKLEVLVKILKINFKNISVPGIIDKNGELLNKANQDYQSAIFLLNRYFFNKKNTNIIYNNNEINKSNINLGNARNNFELVDDSEENEKFLFKNLGIGISSESKNTHSITHVIYKYLKDLNLIPETEIDQLEKFINFIDLSTVNKYKIYSDTNNDFNIYYNSYKMLFGFSKFLKTEKVFNYFKDNNNTGFELLTDEELKKYQFKQTSDKRFKDIATSIEDFHKRKSEEILLAGDIEFILDLNGKIKNCLEVSSSFGKGVIRVHKNGDIVINSPVPFSNGKNTGVYKREDSEYFKNIKKLLETFKGDNAKYFLLKKIGYKGPLYKSLTPDKIIWNNHEKNISDERKKTVRQARADIKQYHLDNQILNKENIKIGSIIYGKLEEIKLRRKDTQTKINIVVNNSENIYYFYTNMSSVKNGKQYNQNAEKGIQNNIRKFKIVSIVNSESKYYNKKIRLKQI